LLEQVVMEDNAAAPQGVRVMVVDDQLPFRRAAKAVCMMTPGFDCIGEAESGEQAVELAKELHPDLVLMDINLPGINGIEATRQITAALPETRVVLLSTYRSEDLPGDACSSGAMCYCHKEEFAPDVLESMWTDRQAGWNCR
jgi:DNA-binding NarL/FixJ family response regulator